MAYRFLELAQQDGIPVIDIFNHYVENSFAAYPENRVSLEFYDILLKSTEGYPRISIRDDGGEVLGFAFLRPYHPMPTFKRAAEISYFIKPEHTCHGAGKAALNWLIVEAKKSGIETLLASICSLNEDSIDFHLKNGFTRCGIFEKIGRKFTRDFDVVWMQKAL